MFFKKLMEPRYQNLVAESIPVVEAAGVASGACAVFTFGAALLVAA